MHQDVLHFWFKEIDSTKWWVADDDFDAVLKERFTKLLKTASRGELSDWRATSEGRLAEIIVLDQFSRNIYRGTPQAFSQDSMALMLAQEAVAAGALEGLALDERAFLLMPFMHSESKTIHIQARQLFLAHARGSNYQFELKHKDIIDRFGRYPHRNQILERASSPEEKEFLTQPGSSF